MNENRTDPPTAEDDLSVLYSHEFLDVLTKHINSRLGTDSAWVGELVGHSSDAIHVVSAGSTGRVGDPEFYEVCGAPCAEVVNECRPVVVVRDASTRYPTDSYFIENSISSYIAVPLVGAAGGPVGILGVCARSRLNNSEEVLSFLERIAPRTARELESIRIEKAIHKFSTVDCTVKSPDELFGELAHNFSRFLGSDIAVITEWRDDLGEQIRVLAYVEGDEVQSSFFGQPLDSEGTPCRRLKGEGKVVIESDLQRLHPGFPKWSDDAPTAYAGTAIYGTNGNILGHFAVASHRPFSAKIINMPLWTVFATHIGVHIQKLKTDRERRLLDNVYTANKRIRDRGFAASVLGHDIGNLLSAASLATELHAEELGEEQTRHLSSMRTALNEAQKLASKLVQQRRQGAENISELELPEFLSQIQAACEAIAADRAEMFVDTNCPGCHVYANPDELAQVVLNLVGNAVDACAEDGGEVTLSACPESIPEPESIRIGRLNNNVTYVAISVTDTGCGIPSDRIEAILGGGASTKGEGHGIGLLAVREIVSRNDGVVAIDSSPRQGTKVTVCWPTSDPTGIDEHEKPSIENCKTVLVVDDEPLIRSTLASVLRRKGLQAVLAGGGQEALQVLHSRSDIDAALIDVSMPGMDGWTLLSELRGENPVLPTVMMSAYFPIHDRPIDDSNTILLNKPFQINDVYESLAKAVNLSAVSRQPG